MWKPSSLNEIDFEKDIKEVFYKDCLTDIRYFSVWNINDNLDSKHEPCNLYALPSQKEIESVFKRLNEDVHSTAAWFSLKVGDKYGVKQKIERVLAFPADNKW